MMNYDCWRTSMAAAAYGGAPCMESARSCIRHVYAFELAAYMVSAHAVQSLFPGIQRPATAVKLLHGTAARWLL